MSVLAGTIGRGTIPKTPCGLDSCGPSARMRLRNRAAGCGSSDNGTMIPSRPAATGRSGRSPSIRAVRVIAKRTGTGPEQSLSALSSRLAAWLLESPSFRSPLRCLPAMDRDSRLVAIRQDKDAPPRGLVAPRRICTGDGRAGAWLIGPMVYRWGYFPSAIPSTTAKLRSIRVRRDPFDYSRPVEFVASPPGETLAPRGSRPFHRGARHSGERTLSRP